MLSGARVLAVVLLACCLALLVAVVAKSDPVSRDRITVVDGDTVKIDGKSWRLMGFDAPETYYAKCEAERDLGSKATARLVALIAAAKTIEAVSSGRTDRYRRTLGWLVIDGADVAETMVIEGLARPYHGRGQREGWCDGQN